MIFNSLPARQPSADELAADTCRVNLAARKSTAPMLYHVIRIMLYYVISLGRRRAALRGARRSGRRSCLRQQRAKRRAIRWHRRGGLRRRRGAHAPRLRSRPRGEPDRGERLRQAVPRPPVQRHGGMILTLILVLQLHIKH